MADLETRETLRDTLALPKGLSEATTPSALRPAQGHAGDGDLRRECRLLTAAGSLTAQSFVCRLRTAALRLLVGGAVPA